VAKTVGQVESAANYLTFLYCISTFCLDEQTTRKNTREQERREKQMIELDFDYANVAPTQLSKPKRTPLVAT
jgi:hypothetical protein